MSSESKKIIYLTPVYNDWESFSILINSIEKNHSKYNNLLYQIIAINDGSIEDYDQQKLSENSLIEIVNLKKNIGHQRAIAVGLQYISNKRNDFDFVIVLDSDGEDKPEDVIHLISKCENLSNNKVIFAQRKKRQESIFFKIGYFFYKQIFYGLTGQKISFGNYSCIPKKLLKRVIVEDNLWNHYSGSIIQSKTPFDKVILDRGKRYAGKSKMNFTSLIIHGFSSISIYFDVLCFRVLKFSLISMFFCSLGIGYLLFQKLFTTNAIPGWASSLILIVLSIVIQLFSVTFIILLLQLRSRKEINPPNQELYKNFINNTLNHGL